MFNKKKTKLVKYINSVENYENKNKRTQTIIKKCNADMKPLRHQTTVPVNAYSQPL